MAKVDLFSIKVSFTREAYPAATTRLPADARGRGETIHISPRHALFLSIFVSSMDLVQCERSRNARDHAGVDYHVYEPDRFEKAVKDT